MNYYIQINYSKFEAATAAIDTYLSSHKKNMEAAGKEVSALSGSWQGRDAKLFQQQWNQVMDDDSISNKMKLELETYADLLRYAANQYKTAQSKAINRANKL